MRSLDLSPLFRSTVGFDHLARMLDVASRADDAYPPYNIEKTGDDAYRITMAVAGFSEDDIEIEVQENLLRVTGRARKEDPSARYLHRGIAGRSFERRFQVADYVRVTGASLVNGLLNIDLVREIPESMRRRTIHIERTAPAPESQAA
ncbi:MAG: Hsp20 family protein [Rhodospirillales bacterium]|nr:Hsp20 family protein [Rhodospirillales bacterium]